LKIENYFAAMKKKSEKCIICCLKQKKFHVQSSMFKVFCIFAVDYEIQALFDRIDGAVGDD
jgi:hypothetical protein